MSDWKPIEAEKPPRDETILVAVEPTAENEAYFGKWPRKTHAAYVDERGKICDASTWKPDDGLNGKYWRVTHWMPLPAPPAGAPR